MGGSHPGKQMQPLCDGKLSGGNVAAIEPFSHVPDAMNKNSQLRKSEDNILSHGDPQSYGGGVRTGGGSGGGRSEHQKSSLSQQLQPQQQPPPPPSQPGQKSITDPYQPGAYNKAVEQQQHVNGAADLTYFGGSKFDPKYQTLPYNTKFSPLANYNGGGTQHVPMPTSQLPPPPPPPAPPPPPPLLQHHHHQQQQPQQWYGGVPYEDASNENGNKGEHLVNNNNNNAAAGGFDHQKLNGITLGKKPSQSAAGHVLTNLGQNLQMQSSSRPINAQVYHTKPLSSNHVPQR